MNKLLLALAVTSLATSPAYGSENGHDSNDRGYEGDNGNGRDGDGVYNNNYSDMNNRNDNDVDNRNDVDVNTRNDVDNHNDNDVDNRNDVNANADNHNDVDVNNRTDNNVNNTVNSDNRSNANSSNALSNTIRTGSNNTNRLNNSSVSRGGAANSTARVGNLSNTGGSSSVRVTNTGSTFRTVISYPKQNPGSYTGPANVTSHPYNCNNGIGAGASSGAFSASFAGSTESDTCHLGVMADLAYRYTNSMEVSCEILKQDEAVADAMKKAGVDCKSASVTPTKVVVVKQSPEWANVENATERFNRRLDDLK